MTDVACGCEVCGSLGRAPLFDKAGYRVVRCTGCGHIFVPLQLTDAELAHKYESEFFSEGAYSDYVRDREVLQRNFARFVAILRSHRPEPGGSLFEIGAAYGFFLDLAKRHWRVQGVDISVAAVAFARDTLGLDVVCGDFLDLPVTRETYDIVVMWDTIEHLRRPRAYVERARAILKPGGILALTTGDVGSLMARIRGPSWRLYHPPFHVHYFSRLTIARLLERCGLRPLEIKSIGFFRSLDTMLFRLAHDRDSGVLRGVYRMATKTGMTRVPVYLNLWDIMLVVARRA
jgi:SAM-dependent methyltransferase